MESTSRERKDEGGREGTPSSGDQLAQDKESRDDHDDVDEQGTRQRYKCTFCRRGFPTAQALGGHMNVHRKHRGRSGAAPTAAVQLGRSYDVYDQHQYSSLVTFAQTTHPASETTASGEEGSMSSFHAAAAERVAEPKELRLFCGAGRGEGAPDLHEDRDHSKDDHGGQGEELDLELRLGGAAEEK